MKYRIFHPRNVSKKGGIRDIFRKHFGETKIKRINVCYKSSNAFISSKSINVGSWMLLELGIDLFNQDV